MFQDVVCPPIGSDGRWFGYAHALFSGSIVVSAAVAVVQVEAGVVQVAGHIGVIGALVAWYSYWIARMGAP